MIFTPDNLIENIDKIGAWSIFSLAETALQHYYPNEFDEDGECETTRCAELVNEMGLNYWQDVVIKYQNEVGYKCKEFSTDYVNAS